MPILPTFYLHHLDEAHKSPPRDSIGSTHVAPRDDRPKASGGDLWPDTSASKGRPRMMRSAARRRRRERSFRERRPPDVEAVGAARDSQQRRSSSAILDG